MTGFLLSPFLVLSRNNAQRPSHRLKFPEEKARNRRYFALGFYIGSLLIIGGLIGLWARWCLGNRDPWLWVIFLIIEGEKKWSRPALLSYWLLLCIISVAGWNRQLARSRRFRPRNAASAESAASSTLADVPSATESINLISSQAVSLGINLPDGTDVSRVAADLLDAADKRVPTLGLNARRKFFHGLVVVMFVPGVAFDVSNYSLPLKPDLIFFSLYFPFLSLRLRICLSVLRLLCLHSQSTFAILPSILLELRCIYL